MTSPAKKIIFAAVSILLTALPAHLNAQQPPAGSSSTPKAAAPFDLTGYWVSIVTEDWRFRIFTGPKGEYPGLPLNEAAKKVADAWDPAKDEAAGEQCKAYGAPGLLRIPTRLHITWEDDSTLKIEADSGTQTRLIHFNRTASGSTAPGSTVPSLQGWSDANWVPISAGPGGPLTGGPAPAHPPGSLKISTSHLRAGYVRKNGIPYSADAKMSEFIDVFKDPNSSGPTSPGETWLMVKTIVNDPTYFFEPFITSTHFKKQANASGWSPSACSAR